MLKLIYWFSVASYRLYDLLLGYPKEFAVYPNDTATVTIRHTGGLWTLRPVYTYTKRRLSPYKQNYRYGWSVVVAPAGYGAFIGRDNLTEDPGVAIYNMLKGQELIDSVTVG